MSQAIGKDGEILEAMRTRQQVILDNIRDNDEAGVNYHMVISQLVVNLANITTSVSF